MNAQELKNEIQKLATETNTTFLAAASAMQSVAAKMGNEEMITAIHKIKMQSIEK
jgi:hypothetical protein